MVLLRFLSLQPMTIRPETAPLGERIQYLLDSNPHLSLQLCSFATGHLIDIHLAQAHGCHFQTSLRRRFNNSGLQIPDL